jgi:leucyl-tRNA synthetase
MMTYGTGAIMAVPSHDERDFEFALKFGLSIIPVIDRPDGVTKSYIPSGCAGEGIVEALRHAGFSYKRIDTGLGITFHAEKAESYAALVQQHLRPGCWCETVGGKWLLVFNDEIIAFGSEETDRTIMARCKQLEPKTNQYRTVMEMLWSRPFYRDVLFHHEYGTMINSEGFSGTPGDTAKQRVTEWLSKEGKGDFRINYRLHDWLISRQRMWGAPIPIVYCDDCGTVAVPYEDLPVLLPEDATFRPTGESPLKFHEGFLNTSCPRCGGPATRETDTMDTFMCSSWYHYAYLSPYYREEEPAHRESDPIDPREAEYWLPVDVYTGGIEHATMHLIYTRFFTKVMRDLGIVTLDEPMTILRNQGIILGEDGEKMSKSRGNVIAPDDLVDRYGADTVRAYLMFGWRWDQGGPWDSQGIEGVVRFLNRVWDCVLEPPTGGGATSAEETGQKEGKEQVRDLRRKVHQSIRKGTEDMESFSFNTYIANLMELSNAMLKAKDTTAYGTEAWEEAVEALLLMLAPACPHIAEEMWVRSGRPYSVHLRDWPTWDEAVAAEETITLIVQVNGKVRDRVLVPVNVDEETARSLALGTDGAKRHTQGKQVIKVIVVPGRLVNIVVR